MNRISFTALALSSALVSAVQLDATLTDDATSTPYEFLLSNQWDQLDGYENFSDHTIEVFEQLYDDRIGNSYFTLETALDLDFALIDDVGERTGTYSGEVRTVVVGDDYAPEGFAVGDVIPHGYGIFRVIDAPKYTWRKGITMECTWTDGIIDGICFNRFEESPNYASY